METAMNVVVANRISLSKETSENKVVKNHESHFPGCSSILKGV
jgi:hypothetical protein